jgi:hypothetical protein
MNKYAYYVEFYGKKLKITMEAESIISGKNIIKDRIIFHKIVPIQKDSNDIFNTIFGDIFK